MQIKNYSNKQVESIINNWNDILIPTSNSYRKKRWKDLYKVDELSGINLDVNAYGRERLIIYFQSDDEKKGRGFAYELNKDGMDYLPIKEIVYSLHHSSPAYFDEIRKRDNSSKALTLLNNNVVIPSDLEVQDVY